MLVPGIVKLPKIIEQKKYQVISGWVSEECFQDSTDIFNNIVIDIKNAKHTILMEMFIFSLDEIGNKILEELKNAAKRGVKIKLVVDGIGSQRFNEVFLKELKKDGIEARSFKPFPWFFTKFYKSIKSFKIKSAINLIFQMNQRNHRKIVVIDNSIAWVGSANVSQTYVTWRETMIRVTGPQVNLITRGFEWVWNSSFTFKKHKFRQNLSNSSVCHSFSWKNKRKIRRFRLKLLDEATQSIKIVNPYFVPPYHFLRAILDARKRGVEVSILTTEINDLFFVRWFCRSYYNVLIKNGVRIYERQERVLHSKLIITEHQAVVGTSNYNYRSIDIDLEIDIIVNKKNTLDELNEQWKKDVQYSKEIKTPPYNNWLNNLLNIN